MGLKGALVYCGYSVVVALGLLVSSVQLQRAFRRRRSARRVVQRRAWMAEESRGSESSLSLSRPSSQSGGSTEAESGVPSIILAEALLACLQTTSTAALILWTYFPNYAKRFIGWLSEGGEGAESKTA